MRRVVEVNDWDEWGLSEALEPWQWAALSVGLPGYEHSIQLALEQSGNEFWEHEQGRAYIKVKNALEAVKARGALQGLLEDGRLLSSGFIVWAWIEGIDHLPSELRQVMRPRSRISKANLRSKYEDTWDSFTADFAKSSDNGLATVASLHDRRTRNGYGYWDEDAALYWARQVGHMLSIAEDATFNRLDAAKLSATTAADPIPHASDPLSFSAGLLTDLGQARRKSKKSG